MTTNEQTGTEWTIGGKMLQDITLGEIPASMLKTAARAGASAGAAVRTGEGGQKAIAVSAIEVWFAGGGSSRVADGSARAIELARLLNFRPERLWVRITGRTRDDNETTAEWPVDIANVDPTEEWPENGLLTRAGTTPDPLEAAEHLADAFFQSADDGRDRERRRDFVDTHAAAVAFRTLPPAQAWSWAARHAIERLTLPCAPAEERTGAEIVLRIEPVRHSIGFRATVEATRPIA